MKSHRINIVMLALAGSVLGCPALAQNPPTAPVPNVPTSPDTDETFLTGLRRVGVMVGQTIECSADANKQEQISEAIELANKIAIHFGLKAAFNYMGAVGYGSGHAFDKASCTQAVDGWKQIQSKYLSK